MATKIHRNSFQGGMNKETDPLQLENIKYSDGYNVSLSQDGREKQLSSFNGTDILSTIVSKWSPAALSGDLHVMGMYEAIYLIGTTASPVETKVALVFLYNDRLNLFNVFVVTDDGTVYSQYEEGITLTDDKRFVDCVIYKEGGVSYAYFTDYEQSIKKLPCIIDTTTGKGNGTLYTTEEIILLRTGFRGGITDVTINTIADHATWKGDLLNGTYQFAVRLFNNDDNKYTKWGLLTNPVVVGMGYSTDEQSYGGVGYVSGYDIDLEITFEENYTDLYTHYQLAVIENINGGDDLSLTAKVLQPEELVDSTAPYIETYNYATNKRAKELILVDELVVDDAAIDAVRTLAVKNNRLILGNIKYHNLDYDNGDPIIANTTAATATRLTGGKAVAYRDPENASKYVGHFRGELYRYGIVYEDEFGNYSKPKVLDFSSITDKLTTVGKDFKFPERSDGTVGTLLEANGDIQALALNLMGIDNHPSWSVGFHIVRAPRKKKVLFQTPLVPSILVQPAKALGNYPDQRSSSLEDELDVLNVSAPNPDGSFVPKNFFHILPKSLIRFGDFYGSLPDGGTVYSTVFPCDNYGTNVFLLVPTTGGTSYAMLTETERILYSNSENDTYKIQVSLADTTYRDVQSADNVTVDIYTKLKGGTSWGTAVNYANYDYQSGTDIIKFTLDTTVNDYKFEISSINPITI